MAEPGTNQTAQGPAPGAAAGAASGNIGAAGRPALDLQRFQQEVAAEIGIDLQQAAQRYPYVRELEPATHSDRQRGGQAGGQ